jgi:hypothetical protein
MAAVDKLAAYTNHKLGVKGGAPFTNLMEVSMNDCSSRIEWRTAITARFSGSDESKLDEIFGINCGIDTAFGSTPTACGG